MHASIGSIASETELSTIAVVVGLACVVGALWARTRAPAVTIALGTGVVTGVVTVWIASVDSPRGVPLVALVSASGAMVTSGFISLWLLPKGGSGRSLRAAALWTVVAAPLVGLGALVSIQHACPLYVTKGAGACYYQHDVLGGWSAAAAVVIALDTAFIAVLLMVSAWRTDRADSARPVIGESLRA